jgi:hypothetical protein
MSPENLPEEEPQPQQMSEVSRLTGVFFEPKKAFADIAERPRWIVPLVLTLLASLVFVTAISTRIGWDRVVRQQLEQRMATMSQDQRAAVEKTMDLQVKIASISGYAAPIIVVPLSYIIMAGVLLGIASGIMSAGIRFKQMFAIVCYSTLPGLISTALSIVVVFLKNPDEFNVQNPLGFNPGAYMDPLTTNKFVHSLATSLDLFVIWIVLLLALGIKAAAGKKLSFAGALCAVAIPWVVVVFGKAAVSGMF